MIYVALAAFMLAGVALFGLLALWVYLHDDIGYTKRVQRQIEKAIASHELRFR